MKEINFRNIAEELYKFIKSETIWKDIDIKRVNKFEKILIKHFKNAKIEQTPTIVETIKEEFGEVNHATLLQRIMSEQDEQVDNTIITDSLSKLEAKHALVEDIKVVDLNNIKRYYVEIHSNGLRTKPNYQIFKGEDIVEKEFLTDNISKHTYVFIAFIDHDNELDIRQDVTLNFINGVVNNIYPVANDYIPVSYANMWQNRTTIFKNK